MGVPDFVKYIARSSPGALCRLPKGDTTQPLMFDFILIDATNAAQTLGLEYLLTFLSPAHILARSAIIFALDSQRDRSGTARSHRHALVRIGDLDIQVQKLSSQMAEVYRSHNKRHRNSSNGSRATVPTASPHILTSGRGVAGEADYKLLDLQRSLLTAAIAGGATSLPSFLFISEDSDVLCGALCGPAPQQVSIATKLQDVLYELSILRLDRVLAFIATCTDAFSAENEREATAAERSTAKAKQQQQQLVSSWAAGTSTAKNGSSAKAQKRMVTVGQQQQYAKNGNIEEADLSVEGKVMLLAPQQPEEDVVRRRKQDGPMVATGVRIELTDSSDDDDEPRRKAETKVSVATNKNTKMDKTNTPMGVAPAVYMQRACKEDAKALTSAAADLAPTEGELTVSTIAYTSSVDMVFLFMIVMGNAVNVPSLMRGATKVDAGSCWQAYCKHKYKVLSASEAETGRVLLTASVSTNSENKGSFVLNCTFLHSILEAVHYADAEARPPGEEEKQRAIAYLSNAVYATLRYVVGCNLEKPPVLQQTFLDSRPLAEKAIMLPSLSAVMWVLGQEATRTFTFPLHGLAKKELLSVASGGAASGKNGLKTSVGGSHSSSAAAAAVDHRYHSRDAPASLGELDVGEHLVVPVAANAWTVSGARASNVSVATLAHTFLAIANGGALPGATTPTTTATGVSLRVPAQLPSMTELLKTCVQKVSPAVLVKANVLVYLITVWEYALGLGVRRLAALTQVAAHVARAEGGEEVFTAAQTASSGVNSVLSADGAAAAAMSRAKNVTSRYVYSFELRRMTPVMQASDTSACQTAAAAAKEPSTAQQAILAALGVSYDYSKTPRAPPNVVNLPHSAMDEEDKAELQRLKKVAKKERALAAKVGKSAEGGTAAGLDDQGAEGDAASKGCGDRHKTAGEEVKKDKAKGKKRPGKRERLQRQKAIKKSRTEKKPTS